MARPLTVPDGALDRAQRHAERHGRRRAVLLVAPLFLFLLVAFVIPIATMLFSSVADDEVAPILHRTYGALAAEGAAPVPSEAVFAALAADLREAKKARTVGVVAKRLNAAFSGARSLVKGTARKIARRGPEGPWRPALEAIDARWASPELWGAIRGAGGPITALFLLNAVDRTHDAAGEIVPVAPEQAIYVNIFGRTFWVSLLVTLLALALGYPLAYFIASLPPRRGYLVLILVLLPFWTSLLVRTTAWIVLLQREGVVNDVALALGILDDPAELVFNRTGVLVAMTHILLPFMVLPLFSVMKGVPQSTVQAARSLGASAWTTFWRVYVPQTRAGIGAGCLLVFILSIGYYITPALVGGPADQLVSYFVALHTQQTLEWGLASALGGILLVATTVLYWVFQRTVGVERLQLG